MSESMIGPWRREDYDSFLALDVNLRPPQRNALLGLGGLFGAADSMQQSMEIDSRGIQAAWALRERHPVYLWLDSKDEFKFLWRQYEKLRKAEKSTAKITSPTAPFILLEIIVKFSGHAFTCRDFDKSPQSKRGSYGPTSERRAAAISRANELLELLDKGVSPDWSLGMRLTASLKKLRDELEALGRKPRGGKGSMMRTIFSLVASELHRSLGISSPAMLVHFADLVEVPCDYKTAQRHFRKAESTYRKALSSALRTAPGQN